MEWTWNGMEWNGMDGWNGMEWTDQMEWNGMEWNPRRSMKITAARRPGGRRGRLPEGSGLGGRGALTLTSDEQGLIPGCPGWRTTP